MIRISSAISALKGLAVAISLGALAAPAFAEQLYTVWLLDPVGPIGAIETKMGDPFLEQRLLPLKLVKLDQDVGLANDKVVAAGTLLFVVFQSDGSAAYCTVKDQSGKNIAKSLFIPALDKRPCLVDRDRNGVFETAFSVFDKYGSALTPSGNLSSAKPLRSGGKYSVVPSSDFPAKRQLSYTLLKRSDGGQIKVRYDNGRGFADMASEAPDNTPKAPKALNISLDINRITGDIAKINVNVDDSMYIIGDSNGMFETSALPEFAKNSGGL